MANVCKVHVFPPINVTYLHVKPQLYQKDFVKASVYLRGLGLKGLGARILERAAGPFDPEPLNF